MPLSSEREPVFLHQPADFAEKKELYLKQLEKKQNLEIFTES